MPDFVTKI